jgi:hypothetical protein
MYFAATLLEFFSRELDAEKMGVAEARGRRPGGIDQLALARQRFSVDPALAWQLINSFRRYHQFTNIRVPLTVETPAPVAGSAT